MNREIKFRAWDKKSKNMVQANIIDFADGTFKVLLSDKDKDWWNDFELTQYTGLQDKNGKEIYEGDILHVTDDNGDDDIVDTGYGDVCFCEGSWYINGTVNNELYDINRCMYIEVIGNIYENQELLKD